MPERQKHGFDFELEYIKKNNLIKEEDYTGKYDAYDSEKNPYQIKTIKKGSSIDLGDIFRNSNKEEDFFLIVSFWEGKSHKISETHKLKIPHEKWNKYLEFEKYAEMKEWIEKVSNSKDYDNQWKKEMKEWKNSFGEDRLIKPRFKRDHKSQKRIQCAINNSDFYNHFVTEYSVE